MTGQQSWITRLDPHNDCNRLQNVLVEKIHKQQGAGPTVILLTSYTPWLQPVEMQDIVRRILETPEKVGLDPTQLPVAIACFFATVVQGVWLCGAVCDSACIDTESRERIREAILNGFVKRNDGKVLTERTW